MQTSKINSIGKFSSSQIYRLMDSDEVAQTYIEEKNLEREFLRKINNESDSHPTSWGKMMEGYAFNKLPVEYKLCSTETLQHHEFDFWVGTPDVVKKYTVGDIKNPFTLKSFKGLCINAPIVGLLKYSKNYYWQLVSNAILTDSFRAELIVHAPYEDEFENIMNYYNDYENKNDMNWFAYAKPNHLPLLKRESKFKDIYILTFQVTTSMKEQLTERVIECSKQLIKVL